MLPTAYRQHFGWLMDDHAHKPHLVLGHNMVGLAMSPAAGAGVLGYLRRHDLDGPVLEPELGAWVFLADANGLVVTSADLPENTRLLGCGVALPVPLTARSETVRWVAPPDITRRWLPSLASIVAAVWAVTRLRGTS